MNAVLATMILILVSLFVGFIFSFIIWKMKRYEKSFPEFLGDYGYTIGTIGFILIGILIALVRTLYL